MLQFELVLIIVRGRDNKLSQILHFYNYKELLLLRTSTSNTKTATRTAISIILLQENIQEINNGKIRLKRSCFQCLCFKLGQQILSDLEPFSIVLNQC